MDRLPRAIVLAGGKSSRFGSNKVFADVGGRSLIELCVSNLLEVFDKIIVVGKDGHSLPITTDKRVRIIYDMSHEYAAIVGLAHGLRSSDRRINYITGCDMPFVAPDLVRRLHHLALGKQCALRCDETETPQPLGGFYSKTCLPQIENMIASGDYKLKHLIEHIDVALLGYQEVVALDPLLRSFYNVNTPSDVERKDL